jgi:hypothetical protein
MNPHDSRSRVAKITVNPAIYEHWPGEKRVICGFGAALDHSFRCDFGSGHLMKMSPVQMLVINGYESGFLSKRVRGHLPRAVTAK